jgi:hypothetical protein
MAFSVFGKPLMYQKSDGFERRQNLFDLALVLMDIGIMYFHRSDKMVQPNLTELALRAAVNTHKRNLASDQSTNSMKDTAEKRAREMITANTNSSSLSKDLDLQKAAIGVAMAGIEVAFFAVKGQLSQMRDQRLSFDKERQAGIATFIIQTDKEEIRLPLEEKIMKRFLELSNQQKFAVYLGIDQSSLEGLNHASFYSVLPFYRMSAALDQQVASRETLDKQRAVINLFFKSAFPEAIADIDMDFQNDNRVVEFFKSAVQKENYLNDLRAPRFIMMSLANLLWNLEHPVDKQTGFPLSTRDIIELCKEVESYLNTLLDKQGPIDLYKLNNKDNQLIQFIRKIENHIKALRGAYTYEQLNNLNIADVTNSAHRALRIMDMSVFKLMYVRTNPLTNKKEHDEQAAIDLAYNVSYMNELLALHPMLMDYVQPYAKEVLPEAMMNTPLRTTVDVLILLCHLSESQYKKLRAHLKKENLDASLGLSNEIKKLYEKFVLPVRAICKEEEKRNGVKHHKKEESIETVTARRLLPFITLLADDYRIEVDTDASYEAAKTSQLDESQAAPIYTGKQQIQLINKMANEGKGYYFWELAPFFKLQAATEKALDNLPKYQFRWNQITDLLDNVSEIVQTYKSFLQLEQFQQFLIRFLSKIKEEYRELEKNLASIDNYLSSDTSMSRGMSSLLSSITKDLSAHLEDFSLATQHFERVLCAPGFTDRQRQLLTSKIGTIHEQFKNLFQDDSGLIALNTTPTLPQAPRLMLMSPTRTVVASKKVVALRNLVTTCFNSLSGESKKGHKGKLIRNLLTQIDNREDFTQEQIQTLVLELTKITASYRSTVFFQAAYGQTRSAKALIQALKSPVLSQSLGLGKILFENEAVDVSRQSPKQILGQIEKLREKNQWQKSVNQIKMAAF